MSASRRSEHPQRFEFTVQPQHPQGRGAHRDGRNRVRVMDIGLAVVAGVEQALPCGELRGDGDDLLTILKQSLGKPQPSASRHAPATD